MGNETGAKMVEGLMGVDVMAAVVMATVGIMAVMITMVGLVVETEAAEMDDGGGKEGGGV